MKYDSLKLYAIDQFFSRKLLCQLLCDHTNMQQYGSQPQICLSVCPLWDSK